MKSSISLGSILRRMLSIVVLCAVAAGLVSILEPPAPAQEPPALEPVPRPELSNREPAERRQIEETRAALDALLESDSVEPAALARAFGGVGRLYLLYDLVDPALPALANAAALAPEEHAWTYYLGVVHQREGRLDAARERFERAVELAPTDLPSRFRLAEVELDAGRLDAAEAAYRAALELAGEAPAAAAAEVGLGRIAYERGRTDEAIERFERALALQPGADSIHHRLGLAHREAGDLDAARRHLTLNRSTPVAYPDPLIDGLTGLLQGASIRFKSGNRAMEEGRIDDAIDEYDRAAEVAPEDPLVHYNLGLALTRAGRRADAVERFRTAVELDPGYRDAHYNLAVSLVEEERFGDAAEHFERAWSIDPLDASARKAADEARFAEATALLREGLTAAARSVLERAIAGRPPLDVFPLVHLLARILATAPEPEVRDGERAVALATEALQASVNVDHAETLAMAYAEVGEWAKAVEWQRRVVDRASERGFPPERVERIRGRLERYERGEPTRAPWEER